MINICIFYIANGALYVKKKKMIIDFRGFWKEIITLWGHPNMPKSHSTLV